MCITRVLCCGCSAEHADHQTCRLRGDVALSTAPSGVSMFMCKGPPEAIVGNVHVRSGHENGTKWTVTALFVHSHSSIMQIGDRKLYLWFLVQMHITPVVLLY